MEEGLHPLEDLPPLLPGHLADNPKLLFLFVIDLSYSTHSFSPDFGSLLNLTARHADSSTDLQDKDMYGFYFGIPPVSLWGYLADPTAWPLSRYTKEGIKEIWGNAPVPVAQVLNKTVQTTLPAPKSSQAKCKNSGANTDEISTHSLPRRRSGAHQCKN
jgi:hypothetical protein